MDTERAVVADPLVPVKVEFDHLRPGQHYFYRAIDASGDTIDGSFATANELGTHHGFNFAIVADQRGQLAPFPAIKNAVTANLDLVVKLGDTIYADFPLTPPPPPATTLDEFRLKHDAVYSTHLGFDFLADLQAVTPVLSMIDDADVRNDFAGGAPPASDPRFAGQAGDFINETALYANGIEAFKEYNAIENRTYSGTGEDRFDGAPDLYRYNTYGSDAAIIMVDARSFRDAGWRRRRTRSARPMWASSCPPRSMPAGPCWATSRSSGSSRTSSMPAIKESLGNLSCWGSRPRTSVRTPATAMRVMRPSATRY